MKDPTHPSDDDTNVTEGDPEGELTTLRLPAQIARDIEASRAGTGTIAISGPPVILPATPFAARTRIVETVAAPIVERTIELTTDVLPHELRTSPLPFVAEPLFPPGSPRLAPSAASEEADERLRQMGRIAGELESQAAADVLPRHDLDLTAWERIQDDCLRIIGRALESDDPRPRNQWDHGVKEARRERGHGLGLSDVVTLRRELERAIERDEGDPSERMGLEVADGVRALRG